MKPHTYILLFNVVTLFITGTAGAIQNLFGKSLTDKIYEKFFLKTATNDAVVLSDLLIHIFHNHITKCVPILLYDEKKYEYFQVIEELVKRLNTSIIHGWVPKSDVKSIGFLKDNQEQTCCNYVLFLNDIYNYKTFIGKQSVNNVVFVTNSSLWRVNEFLSSEESREFINLLVIAPSAGSKIKRKEPCYVLYTHELYVDGIGSSTTNILASWTNGSLTKKGVKLFSKKIQNGFSGHRFITSVGHQSPFVIKRGPNEDGEVLWDGIEIRLLKMLAGFYNFTIDIKSIKEDPHKSAAEQVVDSVKSGIANVGLSGIYLTNERLDKLDVSYPHSYDCAAFISLTSTALPRYRAIMGPFHWTVWLTLTSVYLLAIFPLTFADRHTLKHLIKQPQNVENIFWYVFGTFTNSFSLGKDSWANSSKITPRLLMGFYWIFTTIITACYTGSIIAFIMLPNYPNTVDTVKQLLAGRYRIGTLNRGGWEQLFSNSSDILSQKLLKKIELLPDIESGLLNITKAFFWPYAFLGSRAQLDYIVQTNFTTTNKRSLLHISSECFVPFGVSIVFAKGTIYKDVVDKGISYIIESGFMKKFEQDIKWDFVRSPTGKLLQANSGTSSKIIYTEDRSLTLDDTQGMFLLLGAGYLFGLLSLVLENVGGCFGCCGKKRSRENNSSSSKARENSRRCIKRNNAAMGQADDKEIEIDRITIQKNKLDALFGEENVHDNNQNY